MIQNLISNDAAHVEALLAANRIHDHVAMNADEVLAVKNGVFILPGRINDLHREVLIPVANDFAERVFDGRVIRVHEMSIHILHSERAFAWWYLLVVLAMWGGVSCSCIPTDLLPTMAIFRCFCCGAILPLMVPPHVRVVLDEMEEYSVVVGVESARVVLLESGEMSRLGENV